MTDYFVPVLNIPREKLPLKSEVVHFLGKNAIQTDNVLCRDEVDLNRFTSYILVDHHVSALNPHKIKMIFDHRPQDPRAQFTTNDVFIADVGSCATLVANYILQEAANSTDDEKEVLKLLMGPIILDTINFSPEADKARPLDHQVLARMEAILEIHDLAYRQLLFDDLAAARSDVSSLDSYQILFKDMKTVGNNPIVAVPGYPIRVQEYIRMPAVNENLMRFANELNCDVVVLMGQKLLEGGKILRDLAIVNVKNLQLFAQCKAALEGSCEFQFEQVDTFMGGPVYEQKNIKLSRKQILPILNKLVNRL